MTTVRFLTGITTSGTPHLGNYVGSIRPAVRASLRRRVWRAFTFWPTTTRSSRSTNRRASSAPRWKLPRAGWPRAWTRARVTFYRQSDVPEIPELTWFLTCVTGKGVLNRGPRLQGLGGQEHRRRRGPGCRCHRRALHVPGAHGRGHSDVQRAQGAGGARPDSAHRNGARHGEPASTTAMASTLCHPRPRLKNQCATLPGLDGRKMSKSYDNTIPLFASREQLKKLIAGIVTDSRAPGEPKDTEGSALFQIYQAFASRRRDRQAAPGLCRRHCLGRRQATICLSALTRKSPPCARRYQDLHGAPWTRSRLLLLAGAAKARAPSPHPSWPSCASAVGLRAPAQPRRRRRHGQSRQSAALASFKQYREKDGQFYFKLADGRRRGVAAKQGLRIRQRRRADHRAIAA